MTRTAGLAADWLRLAPDFDLVFGEVNHDARSVVVVFILRARSEEKPRTGFLISATRLAYQNVHNNPQRISVV